MRKNELGQILFSGIDHELCFEKLGYLYDSIIVFSLSIPELSGINGNTGVNVVMECEGVTFKIEVPDQRVEIIEFGKKFNVKIIAENVGNFVKTFKAAIVVNYRFGATEVSA